MLILDGEELRGDRQNRVLNTTILVGMRSTLVVPVSCTEHGRWSYATPAFAPAEYVAERHVRMRLKETVDSSVRAGRGHRSDQDQVWDEVEMLHTRQGTASPTGAMRGAFAGRDGDLRQYLADVPLAHGRQGLLVILGDAVVGFDFLSIPEKYAHVHDKLVRSYVLEAPGAEQAGLKAPDGPAAGAAAQAFLERVAGLEGERFKSPGLGWDVRYAGSGIVGSLLTYRDRPIRAAFFEVGDGDGGRGPGGRGSDDWRIADARTRAHRRLQY